MFFIEMHRHWSPVLVVLFQGRITIVHVTLQWNLDQYCNDNRSDNGNCLPANFLYQLEWQAWRSSGSCWLPEIPTFSLLHCYYFPDGFFSRFLVVVFSPSTHSQPVHFWWQLIFSGISLPYFPIRCHGSGVLKVVWFFALYEKKERETKWMTIFFSLRHDLK